MVWGQGPARGISDLVQRLKYNDPALTSLHILRFRQLDDKGIHELCEALRSNTTLVELSCSSHPISAAAAAAVGQALTANTSLQSLSLGNSTFGDEAQQALCAGLEHNTTLTSLDCEHKGLTGASGAAVAQLLQHHPRLCCLSLSRNPLGDAGIAALSGGWRSLTRLQLSSCDITPKGVSSLAACTSMATLDSLDLSHNPLPGTEGGAAVAGLLAAAPKLRQLQLSQTGLGNEGLQGVADHLTPHPQLQQLDLSSSGCGLQGAAAVARALAHLPGLTALDLSHNADLTDEAAQQLASSWTAACTAGGSSSAAASSSGAAEGLTSPPQQVQRGLALDLSGCQLRDGSLRALLGMPGLTSLNVMGSHLTVAGAQAVASALSGNHALQLRDLNLCACQLGMDGLEVLLPAAAAFAGSAATGVVVPAPAVQEVGQHQKQEVCSEARLVLAVGGNPAVQEDGFQPLLERVLTSSTGLVVHWRAAGGDQPPDGRA